MACLAILFSGSSNTSWVQAQLSDHIHIKYDGNPFHEDATADAEQGREGFLINGPELTKVVQPMNRLE